MSKHDYEAFVNTDEYPRWRESFSKEQREEMMEEDMFVGKTVTRLLTGVVLVGLALAFLGVWVTS